MDVPHYFSFEFIILKVSNALDNLLSTIILLFYQLKYS